MNEKNLLEKSLKRFLKRKVKITLGFIVAFMIMGNVGYCVDYPNGLDIKNETTIDKNNENINIGKTGVSITGSQGHLDLTGKDIIIDVTEALSENFGLNSGIYATNKSNSSLIDNIIKGNNLKITNKGENKTFSGKFSDSGIMVNIPILSTSTVYNGKLTIKLNNDLNINNFTTGISSKRAEEKQNPKDSLDTILDISANNITLENEKLLDNSKGIYFFGAAMITPPNENKGIITAAGDINIINYEEGIVVGENGNKLYLGNFKNVEKGIGGTKNIVLKIDSVNYKDTTAITTKKSSKSTNNSFENACLIDIKGENLFIINYKNGISNDGGNILINLENEVKLENNSILKTGKGIDLSGNQYVEGAKIILNSGGNISLKGYNTGVYSRGTFNENTPAIENQNVVYLKSENGYINISEVTTGIFSGKEKTGKNTGKNSNIILDSNYNEINSSSKGIYANDEGKVKVIANNRNQIINLTDDENSTENLTGTNLINSTSSYGTTVLAENNGLIDLNATKNIINSNYKTINSKNSIINIEGLNGNLAEANYIDSNKSNSGTAVLSEDGGTINLNGKINKITSNNTGVRADSGTVNINQGNEKATGEKTFVSAVNEAVTAKNGGKVNINSSSIFISGNGKADGGNTNFSNEASTQNENGNEDEGLKVYGAVYGYGGEINLTGDEITIHSVNTSHGDISDDNIREEYAGVLSRGGSTITLDGTSNIISENGVALYATDIREEGSETFANSSGSKIVLSDKGNHEIYGDIIAGKNSTIEINGNGNKISSGNSNENIEVMAGNNGKVDLDLTKGTLTGRIDDYQEAGEFGKGTFRNNKFYLDITESGEVNLDLTEGTWNALGQSFVTKISGENVTVNMSEEEGNSIHINSLEGNGTIIMHLDSDAVDNKGIKTDMLYISNVADDAEYTLKIADENKILNLENGEQLRFATIKGENKENVKFSLFDNDSSVKGRGVRNVEFKIVHDDYKNSDSDNENYNGSSEGMQKPGDEFVDKNFGEDSGDVGENYSFMKTGGQSDNEITHTIISMAKANYNSLVYMDNLNKRLGDMRFASGTEGIWVRLRNDRVGEDDVYRLHNNMTQVGYDKFYSIKNGEEHRGIAFEYTRGDMDYKEFDGESNIDKYLISFYDTRLYNNGFYTDFIVKGGKADSDFEIYAETNDGKTKVKGDYDNLFFGVGAEFGRRFDFDNNYYFEPQVQLQYTYIGDTDYTTNQNTKVDYSDINSLIGRAGFRIGKDFYKENSRENTIYFKTDINHEFLGEQDVEAMDITGKINETYHNDKSWFDIGIGGAKNITEDLNVYFDVERQVGESKDNSWQFNLGFRYNFNSAEDFSL